jgi:hypothetical protein
MARESWHPRWHATIDGTPAAIRRVTPNFPAVDVPAGHHVLAFRFQRPWWALASWLAWPLVPLLAWRFTRNRAQRPNSWLAPRYLDGDSASIDERGPAGGAAPAGGDAPGGAAPAGGDAPGGADSSDGGGSDGGGSGGGRDGAG